MAIIKHLNDFSPEVRALIAVGVILDGAGAADYLLSNKEFGLQMSRMAKELSSLPSELVFPLLGTILRRSLDM